MEDAHDRDYVAFAFGLEVVRAAYSDTITFSNDIFDDHFGLNEFFASFTNVVCEIDPCCVFELSSVSVCAIRRQDVFEDLHFTCRENVHEESADDTLVRFYSHSLYPAAARIQVFNDRTLVYAQRAINTLCVWILSLVVSVTK